MKRALSLVSDLGMLPILFVSMTHGLTLGNLLSLPGSQFPLLEEQRARLKDR